MAIEEAKKKYNELLTRYHKANKYFENENVSQAEKEMFLPEFQRVISQLSLLLGKIGTYTKQEATEGFK